MNDFASIPSNNLSTNEYVYDLFEVKETITDGLGVFANIDITTCMLRLLLSYGGVVKNDRAYEKILKKCY